LGGRGEGRYAKYHEANRVGPASGGVGLKKITNQISVKLGDNSAARPVDRGEVGGQDIICHFWALQAAE